MTTKTEDRLLGVAVAALLTTIGGELAGTAALVTLGVTTFALALVGLLIVMPLSLLVGLTRSSGPDMHAVSTTDRSH
jgi:hypothetical protein